jgi:hypothetical protein
MTSLGRVGRGRYSILDLGTRAARPGHLTSSTPSVGGCVDARTGLDAVQKNLPLAGIETGPTAITIELSRLT